MALLDVQAIGKTFRRAAGRQGFELPGVGGDPRHHRPERAGKTTAFNMIAASSPRYGIDPFQGETSRGGDHGRYRIGRSRATFQLSKPSATFPSGECHGGRLFTSGEPRGGSPEGGRDARLVGMAHQATVEANNLTATDRKRLELARSLATGSRASPPGRGVAGATPTEGCGHDGPHPQVRPRRHHCHG